MSGRGVTCGQARDGERVTSGQQDPLQDVDEPHGPQPGREALPLLDFREHLAQICFPASQGHQGPDLTCKVLRGINKYLPESQQCACSSPLQTWALDRQVVPYEHTAPQMHVSVWVRSPVSVALAPRARGGADGHGKSAGNA